jgi:hypothetical protein
MGQVSRKIALEHSLDHVIKEFEQLYQGLVERTSVILSKQPTKIPLKALTIRIHEPVLTL